MVSGISSLVEYLYNLIPFTPISSFYHIGTIRSLAPMTVPQSHLAAGNEQCSDLSDGYFPSHSLSEIRQAILVELNTYLRPTNSHFTTIFEDSRLLLRKKFDLQLLALRMIARFEEELGRPITVAGKALFFGLIVGDMTRVLGYGVP
ncbi:hypothetical protein GMOD_00006816 [Pyrenophora seminiperda CCB06]|uniref:Uncharacterized protein n=1 Tax=Pyrenophora seminiperda CCB06 TaxID=1302712 RepID=A0A3M7MBD7_9PLEO|nr:hypothetical protein GMOD_00006816 [Pyrenophora seminiperda CCB06]